MSLVVLIEMGEVIWVLLVVLMRVQEVTTWAEEHGAESGLTSASFLPPGGSWDSTWRVVWLLLADLS